MRALNLTTLSTTELTQDQSKTFHKSFGSVLDNLVGWVIGLDLK